MRKQTYQQLCGVFCRSGLEVTYINSAHMSWTRTQSHDPTSFSFWLLPQHVKVPRPGKEPSCCSDNPRSLTHFATKQLPTVLMSWGRSGAHSRLLEVLVSWVGLPGAPGPAGQASSRHWDKWAHTTWFQRDVPLLFLCLFIVCIFFLFASVDAPA